MPILLDEKLNTDFVQTIDNTKQFEIHFTEMHTK